MGARLFTAIVPPDRVVEELDAFLEPRRVAEPRLRWTRPETWHLTTAFMPDVPDGSLDRLVEGLDQAAARTPAFDLALAGGGAFPHALETRLLWLGVMEAAVQPLAQLAERSRNAAVRSGVRVDGARFTPHLSLARAGRPLDTTRLIRVLDTFEAPGWFADELVLVQSHLHDQARRYEVLERFTLAGHPGEERTRKPYDTGE
ncbi:2'-5' RNA ligase [Raineyella antarctica]|uniref:RNA 2',3'-cyclic phosphodiesterase n=1 Tax=Raineyella antarctica TaxID=1577474 RepID=A0A1G6GPB6_9ACTN|nr:RNA 2',3'-cyclic phosphodiesterase [Raineyella antarctica]SDB83036.1 2'-5' RNA ligase [Raineyella antarctica]